MDSDRKARERTLSPPALHTVQIVDMMTAAALGLTVISGLAVVSGWQRFWFAVPAAELLYADAARRLRRIEPDGFSAWRTHMIIATGFLVAGGVPLSASMVVFAGFVVLGFGWVSPMRRTSVVTIAALCATITIGGLFAFGQWELSVGGQLATVGVFLALAIGPLISTVTPVRDRFIDRMQGWHDTIFADRRLHDLIIDIPTGYYRTSADGRIVEANPAFQHLIGRADLIGVEHSRLLADPGSNPMTATTSTVVDKVERSYLRPGGSVVWLSESVRVRVDAGGGLEGYEAIAEDVTTHREYERATSLAMSRLNVRLRYQVGIGQLARLLHLGTTKAVLPAALQPLHQAVPGWLGLEMDGEQVVSVGQTVGGTTMSESVVVGGRPVGLLSWQTSDTQNDGELKEVMATAAEILGGFLQRVDAHQELQEINDSKDQFIAAVSHELRTPLTAIMGFTDYLENRWDELSDEERRLMLKTMASESREMAAIIDDLLAATRARFDELDVSIETVNALEGVHDVLRSLVAHRDPASVAVEVPPDLHLRADPVRYRQVLRNLLTNAFRYGGPQVSVRSTTESGWSKISVTDSGPAMPEQLREMMFAPYRRIGDARSQPGSTGLGLYVSRTLAELMNGTLVYCYRDGSSFDLTLPVAPG